MPDEKKKRFLEAYGLSAYDAGVLVAERACAEYFETAAQDRDPKVVANWLTVELFGALNRAALDIEKSPVSARALGGLIDLIADSTISGRIAKEVFAEMFETGGEASDIVAEKGLKQVTDTREIEAVVDVVLAQHEGKVSEFRAGKEKLFGFFVGQVMKATKGKANPKSVNEILRGKLSG